MTDATAKTAAPPSAPLGFGSIQRDPLDLVFGPQSLSGTERLVLLGAAQYGTGSGSYRRGQAFRSTALRPIFQLARLAQDRANRPDAPAGTAEPAFALRDAHDVAYLLEQRWGAEFRHVRAMFRRLVRMPNAGLMPPKLGGWLATQRQEPGQAWLAAHQWGTLADVYLADLAYFASVLSRAGDMAEAARLEAAQLALLTPESRARLEALQNLDRGTLLCGVHAGMFGFGRRVMRALLPNLLLLGAHGEGVQSGARVSANDPVRAMLQMVRHLRQPGATAVIGADGPVANAMATVDVLGRPMRVALGAPHTIHHARCANAFVIAAWNGDAIDIELRTDTQPAPGEPLAAWTERWLAAWAEFLRDIVLGDGRNLRGYSGFWSQLGADEAPDPAS